MIAELTRKFEALQRELRDTRDLANLAIAANIPGPEGHGSPLQFPPLNSVEPRTQYGNTSPASGLLANPVNNNPPTYQTHQTNADNNPNVYHPQNRPQTHQTPENIQIPQNTQTPQNTSYLFNPNVNLPQNTPSTYQNPVQPIQNPLHTRLIPPIAFHTNITLERHVAFPHPEVDHYEEKEWRSVEEKHAKDMMAMREDIVKIRESHGSSGSMGLSYDDLCIHPDLDLPEGYKVPKFETFNGTGNLLAHLRAYCDQIVGVGRNEAILMRLFSRSLSGEALEWFASQDLKKWVGWKALAKDFIERFAYNVKVVHDRYSLNKIKQEANEHFREYAYRWRKEAAKVRPPMSEDEIVAVFSRAQEGKYYKRMISAVRATFADLVKIGESVEEGFRTGKFTKTPVPTVSSSFPKRKKEEISAISFSPSPNKKKNPRDPHPVFHIQTHY